MAFSIQVTEADGAGRGRKGGRTEFLRTPWNQREIITELRRECVTKHKRDRGKMTEREGAWSRKDWSEGRRKERHVGEALPGVCVSVTVLKILYVSLLFVRCDYLCNYSCNDFFSFIYFFIIS